LFLSGYFIQGLSKWSVVNIALSTGRNASNLNVEARFKRHAVADYLFLTIRLDYTPTVALKIVESNVRKLWI
jgi:hypothetical protein